MCGAGRWGREEKEKKEEAQRGRDGSRTKRRRIRKGMGIATGTLAHGLVQTLRNGEVPPLLLF